ncbi:MAG: hypothetical protein GY719_05885 [bacterium]|nr:hypothetical protein [bacterium]
MVYRPGESTLDFLSRYGIGLGPVKPGAKRLPYYLLLVGSPEQIPFSVQYKLDVQYGVGRLWLEGTEAYARYAKGVVRAETGELRRPKKFSLVGVSNPGDRATSLSRQELVEPLGTLADKFQDWSFDLHVGDDARKGSVGQLLGGPLTPALLFFAGHGLGYPNGYAAQRDRQGALVCQDWAGPGDRGITEAESFAATDLSPSADPSGMIAFFFACFGAGTPHREDFHGEGNTPEALAPAPFISRLPQRLLGNPGGTALAVVGHVERAWTYSFLWPSTGPQLQVFESTLGRLLNGYPVGAAMEYFGQRFAELAVHLQAAQADLRFEPDPDVISAIGTAFAFKDARAYVVLGDPAVRVAVEPFDALRGDAK